MRCEHEDRSSTADLLFFPCMTTFVSLLTSFFPLSLSPEELPVIVRYFFRYLREGIEFSLGLEAF